MMENYLVAETEIIIESNTNAKVNGESITGIDRMNLLKNIGKHLKEECNLSFPSVMGFYNVVPLK